MRAVSNKEVLTRADREGIEQKAVATGFDLAGVAAVPASDSEQAEREDGRYTEWIAEGRAGEMEYLKRVDEQGRLLRGDLRRAMPWARSVVVCAYDYGDHGEEATRSIDPAEAGAGWIARYAWSGKQDGAGSDYHDVLLTRLRAVEAEVRQRFPGCETRCYVDTGPIVERGYAALAGVGWIGKNTCVIHQQQGSWLLLGVIVTSLELEPEAWSVPAADRCGSCTRCIEACPTDALVAPREMDASRCISYLTIEKKGSIEEALRPLMGRQVFGCDICQEVCPWNSPRRSRQIAAREQTLLPPRRELVNPALDWLASMDGATFNRWFRGSPLERTRRRRVLRNVAIAMGNSGDTRFLPLLDAWSREDDAVLAEAAAWSVTQLRGVQQGKVD